MVEDGDIRVYNPREDRGKRMVSMVSERLLKIKKTREWVSGRVNCVCVVENVLYACFQRDGLMWFGTELNVWRKLVSRDGREFPFKDVHAMAEYEGKLAAFRCLKALNYDMMSDNNTKGVIKIFLFALDRVKDSVCGTIEWFGVVATIPCSSDSLHCFNVSD
ncbi:unnamed protein product [Microthlaspi erraticum]|uniref:F-box associated domain-containing protein n=1 Tax=Microthlaspi erraticum TaxID=1685480 RepID=A0A6D2L3B3_9BRAS|nr:unnamed protein product [Microthlaspi erraticum]